MKMKPTKTRHGRKRKAAEPAKPAVSFTRAAKLSEVTDEIWPLEVLAEEYPEITSTPKRMFLAAMTVVPRYGKACKLAGVTPKTVWNWRNDKDDPLFQQAFERARQIGAERIASEIIRRGVEGYEKPVWHQGQLAGTERVYSDTLLLAAAKAAMPEQYAEQRRIAAPGGGPLQTENKTVYADLSLDQMLTRMRELTRELEAAGTLEGTGLPDIEVRAEAPQDAAEAAYLRKLAERGNGSNGNGSHG